MKRGGESRLGEQSPFELDDAAFDVVQDLVRLIEILRQRVDVGERGTLDENT